MRFSRPPWAGSLHLQRTSTSALAHLVVELDFKSTSTPTNKRPPLKGRSFSFLERAMRFELTTLTLAR